MKAIIFDLDGVLVFTDHFHYKAWKKLADEIGVYFDEEINHRLRGVSRRESLEIILEKYSGEKPSEVQMQQWMECKNEMYKKLLSSMSVADVTEEVRSTLKKLREQGKLLAVGSSSKNARFILEKTELTEEFDAIADGTDISHSKPDPEVFLKAAEFLGVQPKDCCVVEDAFAGIDAAKAAGMMAIGIGDAAGYEKCDKKIQNFTELSELMMLDKEED